MSRRDRLTVLGALVGLAVFAADQGSKYWILHGLDLPRRGDVRVMPHLDLTMVWNRGVTFGLLTGTGGWSVAILAGVALAIVAVLGVWLRRTQSTPTAVALGAIAGGAVGNVTDRLRYGAVVDFIRAHAFGWSWYVFNLGDAAIVCGVIALALLGGGTRPPRPAPTADDPAPGDPAEHR
ncbi:MAG: signal peptidase II [Rhodospirillales bacterium]|nr:signal peptidase II [Rhodospirillales bacterium]